MNDLEYYSLALDESTDIRETAQLASFIRTVDKDSNVFEQLVDLNAMKGTSRGIDVFKGLQSSLQKIGIENFSKCISVATDGAPSMVGYHNGLIAKVRELKPDVVAVDCIIHQENLSAKAMDMEHVTSVVVKAINYICSRELSHREFQEFLGHLESHHGDVVYFTDVHWLSRASTLHRFWLLKDEVNMFVNLKGKEVPQLSDSDWLMDFAFLNDISQASASLMSSCKEKTSWYKNC